jgi:hypothetical protein
MTSHLSCWSRRLLGLWRSGEARKKREVLSLEEPHSEAGPCPGRPEPERRRMHCAGWPLRCNAVCCAVVAECGCV